MLNFPMRRSHAFLLALGIIVLLVANSADFFRQPYYEYWDLASNSLAILRAKHFAQLYGAYSRYGFYHPGPAFFYVDALGEWLFHDVLHAVPSPFHGQFLGNLCLMTGFYVAALSIFARWLPERRRWLFLCAALVLGIPHFCLMGNLRSHDVLSGPSAFTSVWPVHSLVLPFLCLLTAGAAIGAGRGQYLPLLVLAGGFLVEHVAMPVFIVPVAVVAYVGLVVSCARRQRAAALPGQPPRTRWWLAAWRDHPRAHLFAAALLGLFLLPMLIDLSRGRQSNFATILRVMHEQSPERKKLVRSFAYFLQFGAYAAYKPGELSFSHYDLPGFLAYLRAHAAFYVFWLLVLFLVAQAPFVYLWNLPWRQTPPATDGETELRRRFLAWTALMAALSFGLTLYWGTHQDGWMFFYNSWFNYAIYYFAALIAVAVLCSARPGSQPSRRSWLVMRAVGVGAVILTAVLFAGRLRVRDDESEIARGMHERIQQAIADADRRDPSACKALFVPDKFWAVMTAVGLELARHGDPFVVSGRWKILFGDEHQWQNLKGTSLRDDGFRSWYVLLPGTSWPGVPAGVPAFPMRPVTIEGVPMPDLMMTPPILELSAAGSTAEIRFGKTGNSEPFTIAGWGLQDDPAGAWSAESWAAFAFRPQVIAGTCVEVLVTGIPFLAPSHGLNRQRVRVYLNGTLVCPEQALTTTGTLPFLIPASVWNAAAAKPDAQASLSFEFPDAVVPASIASKPPNDDYRHLAVYFNKVQLRVVP